MLDLCLLALFIEVLGWLCLPLTVRVCRNLPDRGWALSKTLGLAWLAFAVWFPLMCIHALSFQRSTIMIVLLCGALLSLLSLYRGRRAYRDWLRWGRTRLAYLLSCELIFLGSILLLGYVRSYGPQLAGYEMFMNEGMLASIMRSQRFPPGDMWLAGYSINYYYYSLYILALLGKLLGQSPSLIANTGICLVFGLCALNIFGVSCNTIAWSTRFVATRTRLITTRTRLATKHTSVPLNKALPYGFLALLMGLIFGNLAATQQWWQNHDHPPQDYSVFWQAPAFVIHPRTNISEFPALAFVLSCFHAHVLTLAFTIATLGLALNLLLEPDGVGLAIFGRGGRRLLNLATCALLLGGLYAMNGWDLPTYFLITCLCILGQQWLVHRRQLDRSLLVHGLQSCAALAVLAVLLFLPFYLTFVSPAQGIGLVSEQIRSPFTAELLIYGLFIFLFISLLLIAALKLLSSRNVPLSDISYSLYRGYRGLAHEGSIIDIKPTGEAERVGSRVAVAVQEVQEIQEEKVTPTLQTGAAARSSSLLTLLCPPALALFLLACLLTLILRPLDTTLVLSLALAVCSSGLAVYHLQRRTLAFCLLLGALSFWLIALCEIVFLKDDFAATLYARSNTIFKFYFQCWILLSIACAAGLFFIVAELRRRYRMLSGQRRWLLLGAASLWGTALIVLLAASALYPLVAPYARYVHLDAAARPYLMRSDSLDGMAYLKGTPDYDAIRWLNEHVAGTPAIVEVLGKDGSQSQRISAFTGLPDIVGWLGHEHLWRVNWLKRTGQPDELTRRTQALDIIYSDPYPQIVLSEMRLYHARYIYIGPLERLRYPHADLDRYWHFMRCVYQSDGVSIYQSP